MRCTIQERISPYTKAAIILVRNHSGLDWGFLSEIETTEPIFCFKLESKGSTIARAIWLVKNLRPSVDLHRKGPLVKSFTLT